MTRAQRSAALAAFALVVGAPRAAADGSVFGIRGLGILGRQTSARSASAGGGFGMFDAAGGLNPAALSRWRTIVGWAVSAASRRRLRAGAVDASLTSTRFPVFGFATLLGERLVLGVSVADYLDRNWSVSREDTVVLHGSPVAGRELTSSTGGVSDFRLAAAFRLSPAVAIGLGMHSLAGSTRLEVQREFADDAFLNFSDRAITEFSGFGVSVGALAAVRPSLALAASVRFNSDLEARSTSGARATVALPVEMSLGAQLTPVAGVSWAGSVGYATWSRAADDLADAGEARSRDIWSVEVGLELETASLGSTRLPLRLGYRWRQLPFPVGGDALGERAFSAGIGLDFAGRRATADLGVERGTRVAGRQSERFTTAFVGLVVRP